MGTIERARALSAVDLESVELAPARAVTGTAVDAIGAPVRGAHAAVLGDRAILPWRDGFAADSNAEGRFQLRIPADLRAFVSAATAGYASIPVPLGDGDHRLVLRKTSTLRLTLPRRSDQPYVRHVLFKDSTTGAAFFRSISGTAWENWIRDVPAGAFVVHVTGNGWMQDVGVDLRPGETTHLELRPPER